MKQESKKHVRLMAVIVGLTGLLLPSSSFAGSPAPSQHAQSHNATANPGGGNHSLPMVPPKPPGVSSGGNCSLGSYTLDFGMLPSNPGHDIIATGSLTIHCPPGLPVAIDLSNGAHGMADHRRMALAAPGGQTQYLEYQLFTEATGASIWGTGFAGGRTMNLVGTGTPQTVRIYGRITTAGTSPVTIGSYSDNVAITLSF